MMSTNEGAHTMDDDAENCWFATSGTWLKSREGRDAARGWRSRTKRGEERREEEMALGECKQWVACALLPEAREANVRRSGQSSGSLDVSRGPWKKRRTKRRCRRSEALNANDEPCFEINVQASCSGSSSVWGDADCRSERRDWQLPAVNPAVSV